MLGINKSYIFNFWGTIFDKGLVLIVSFIYTSYLTVDVFGVWSLFQNFIIIGSGILISPSMNLYSKFYYLDEEYKNKIIVKYNSYVALSFLIFIIVYYLFYTDNLISLLLQIACLAVFMSYNYYSLALRFKNDNARYFYISGLRFFLFLTTGWIIILYYNKISLFWLYVSFFVSTLVVVFPVFKKLSFQKEKVNGFLNDEISTIMAYGLLTALLNSIDKFAIGLKSGDYILGKYSYIVAITTASNVIVEVLKKVHAPILFKGYSDHGVTIFKFPATIKIQLIALFVLQVALPFVIMWIVGQFNSGQKNFLNFDNVYIVILLQSIGFAIFSLYHFINLKFIFSGKVNWMVLGILISTFLYVFIISLLDKPNIMNLSILRFALLTIPVLLLVVKSKKLNSNER